ncbi:MAG: ribonuclease III [bacterium]|nr:ribonuclease III [bacterium]
MTPIDKTEDLDQLQERLGYRFKSLDLLQDALTHKSFLNENRHLDVRDNERMEFLGDAVLDLVVTDLLYNKFPEMKEGDLSKKRSSIVRESALYAIATDLGLGSNILLGRGEMQSGGDKKSSLLADTFEALVAAVYLDGGIAAARRFIDGIFTPLIDAPPKVEDYKSRFQELCQKDNLIAPTYKVINSSGPDHDKLFDVELEVGGKAVAVGRGKSIKEAERQAAKAALREIYKLG